jgi:hypothetical protein
MKKLLILIFLSAVVYPKYPPMFNGMIMRCNTDGECHWECEYGVEVETTTVHQNLIVKPSGCRKENTQIGIYSPYNFNSLKGL